MLRKIRKAGESPSGSILFIRFKYQGFIATKNEKKFPSLEEKKADEMEVEGKANEERKAQEKAATIIN